MEKLRFTCSEVRFCGKVENIILFWAAWNAKLDYILIFGLKLVTAFDWKIYSIFCWSTASVFLNHCSVFLGIITIF